MAITLTEATTVVVTSKQVSSNLAGEEVIMQLDSGVYYGLEAVGASIWALIQQPRTVAAVCEGICAEYDVDRETCSQDVQQFLTSLIEAKLAEVVDVPEKDLAPSVG